MNEQRFSELMQYGRLNMPFRDFEERTMARIQKERAVKSASARYRKLSWVFFILGAVLGGLATGLVSMLPAFGSERLVLTARLVYVCLLLAGINYLVQQTPRSQTQ
ncbi:hypothetical protein MKQ68_12645 [Chitinophaga horti]|uniref:Uncharacterized protein n=1 Tax=Chitinophaga horti TaxID=2920382 RepID=A0ABY6JCL0_9BACT|nr:hypothetical protein [Chitinophaga horti]UYQ95949.1 hypothetical protein MKQ68_12645 [Chitinophaga horti]